MLMALQVRNFALIENVTVEFGEGLNILSGETGVGKSILVEALELLLGSRAQSDLIRQGTEEAEVIGHFQWQKEDYFLRRVLSRSGKHKAFLNERLVPLSALQEVTDKTVDLVIQHEHQVLLRPSCHLRLVDDYVGLEPLLKNYRLLWNRYLEKREEIEKIEAKIRESKEREDFLRFQLKELQEARLHVGEEESLQQERGILKNASRIVEISNRTEEILETGEGAVSDRLARLQKEMQALDGLEGEWGQLPVKLQEVLDQLQEISRSARSYREKLVFDDPHRLEEIEHRFAVLQRLKKKYGMTIEELLKKQKELEGDIILLEGEDDSIQALHENLEKIEKELLQTARQLSKSRHEAIIRLSQEVEKELRQLALPALFSVQLLPLNSGSFQIEGRFLNEQGGDEAEFFMAPNQGEGNYPLAKIASGGELSRLFLALKKVLGQGESLSTVVFDEIDAGIGGRVAEVVGQNLAQLARKKQVICVTHLPQIACYAHHHFVIHKRSEKGRTHTAVQRLESIEREEEIARMLAGVKITKNAMTYAREMIRNASGYPRGI